MSVNWLTIQWDPRVCPNVAQQCPLHSLTLGWTLALTGHRFLFTFLKMSDRGPPFQILPSSRWWYRSEFLLVSAMRTQEAS